jgi:hypothetical protein
MIFVLPLVVFGAMAFQDVFSTAKIELLEQRHPWLAGMADGFADVGGALSVGIGGASILRYGFSPETLLIMLALWSASVVGARIGYWLTNRNRIDTEPPITLI